VLAAVGLVDDLRPLPWQWRLGAQALVAGTAVAFALPPLPGWGQVVAVVWLVALTNAFNMLDNMDTLAGGAAFIAAGCLTWALGYPSGVPYVLLVMSLIGFLHFNRPPARIFMGDTGSMFLGFVIGFAALRVAVQPDGPPWSPLVALCVCAVPLYDQASVVLLRLCQGRSPFHADKQHLSHRLVARGLSSKAAVGLIHLLALVSGAAGLLLYAVSSWVPAALIAGLVGAGWLGLAAYEFAVVGWPPPGADTPGSPAPPAPPGEAPRPDDARPR
jgi:UDP-GlcNAc:undecaprenyl-phosphate GlcNAc-1-phosphate transferase